MYSLSGCSKLLNVSFCPGLFLCENRQKRFVSDQPTGNTMNSTSCMFHFAYKKAANLLNEGLTPRLEFSVSVYKNNTHRLVDLDVWNGTVLNICAKFYCTAASYETGAFIKRASAMPDPGVRWVTAWCFCLINWPWPIVHPKTSILFCSLCSM